MLEERNVTAHKVRLKRITDLVLDAHPTHAAEHAAATTLTTPAAALTPALAATTLALPAATLRRRCALLRERRHGQQ